MLSFLKIMLYNIPYDREASAMKQKRTKEGYPLAVRILAIACAVLIAASAFLFLFFAGQ